jgi:DNA polymerase III subunit delta'
MLLPTIVSRCCHVRFQPLEDSFVAAHIEETFHVPEARARELAFLAEGSLEKARLLTDVNRIAHWKRVLESVRTLRTLSMLDFFALTTQWAKDTEDLEQDLKYIKLWIRDIILTRLGIGREAVFESNAELTDSDGTASDESLFQLYGCVEEALRDLRQNANKQLVLEGVCFAIKKGLYGQGDGDTVSKGRQGLSL